MDGKSYDVVVCGAGTAGVAAAVAAARSGMNTALVEKQCLLGGLATSGLIYVYLPLCDGFGNQVIHGLSEEMIRRSVEYGPFDVPERWGGPKGGNPGVAGDRFQCCFSPAGFSLTLDMMLKEAGVDLWIDSVIIDAQTENDRVCAITVTNTSGQVRISGKCFVDATGGANVVQMAGGKVFRNENFITPWVMEMAEDPHVFHFEESLHIESFGAVSEQYRYPRCASGKLVTAFVRKSWEIIRERYDSLPAQKRKKNYPVHLPAMPQFRKIACIDALRIIDDMDRDTDFEDSIGKVPDWRCPAPPMDIPYRSLIPRNLDGILAAGRCIGAKNDAWEITRVIPVAAKTGEAAGLAASITVTDGVSPAEINFGKLKKALGLQVK